MVGRGDLMINPAIAMTTQIAVLEGGVIDPFKRLRGACPSFLCFRAAMAVSPFSVTDTGPGIPLDQRDRIFEQFHQVDSSMTKAKGGTGLGLAIAKQIVEMHGGRIWVVSTPGKGSTFRMELPTRAQFHKTTP